MKTLLGGIALLQFAVKKLRLFCSSAAPGALQPRQEKNEASDWYTAFPAAELPALVVIVGKLRFLHLHVPVGSPGTPLCLLYKTTLPALLEDRMPPSSRSRETLSPSSIWTPMQGVKCVPEAPSPGCHKSQRGAPRGLSDRSP